MKVVTFGEIMLRLAPEGYLRFLQEPKFGATIGGGEANVAVSLANFGENVSFVTKLPNNAIADNMIKILASYGVDITNIARGGERVGIYYLEKGASVRPSKVIYDRAYSSISMAEESDFDWNKIFEGADWFHFSGITPALSPKMAVITEEALKIAKSKGVTISCDINYRKKLWSKESAQQVMTKLFKYVDIAIGNEEDCENVFGIAPSENNINGGKLNKDGYVEVAEKLMNKFNLQKVAITLRESLSANDNNWSAMIYDGKNAYFSNTYQLHIVDRVGGGDSFSAGLIYALRKNMSHEQVIDFAVCASALKHTIEGDFNQVSVSEVLDLIKNGGSGRVQR